MRSAASIMMILLLVLAGSAVYAQCCPAAPKAVQCPAQCPAPAPKPVCPAQCPTPKPACPTACPAPVASACGTCLAPAAPRCGTCPTACAPPPCPAACPCPQTPLNAPVAQCPCPQSTPAALGAGPCAFLGGLSCADFDKAYVQKIYEQNTVVIAVASVGIARGQDQNIKDISGEIRTERTKENIKLADWYASMGFGTIPVDYGRVQNIVDSLCAPMGACFDVAYAKTMIGLLQQSRDADALAMEKSTIPDMRAQAGLAVRYHDDEIFRLQRWVNEKGNLPGA